MVLLADCSEFIGGVQKASQIVHRTASEDEIHEDPEPYQNEEADT